MITIEHHEFRSLVKITGRTLNPLLNTITLDLVPYEATIHPYHLAFAPPLIEHATEEGRKGFQLIWEKMNFAFGLPDPSRFPILPAFTEEDRVLGSRFIKVCRRLAGYTAINCDSRLSYTVRGSTDQFDINVDFPTDEAFTGTSVAFRQLHSNQETAPFDKVKGRLFRAVQQLPNEERDSAKAVLEQWKQARGKLMSELLHTIVCRKAAPPNPPEDFPLSYSNIRPESIINTFQYGDVIHFSDEHENLRRLTENATNDAYHRYAVLLAITGLSHLYFGFALLVEAAMRVDAPAQKRQDLA
ncbi:hypothetical protein FZI85_13945 [Mycobacterium sp. CBMA293]|nr:hypothetical protein [Mycolicibacterium sp. CBMA 360]MUL59633.1 hypothetical protein [Mycolicibacterium sp. CBMA 335]MUL71358.1 hypothetical protein [Mycolicibacterium sp. CBMA 311]MUL95001.1 hypothetical protein [Mycolicibacterium sp. CBMA 230]MUM03839.1 hypothetical protein [Mycolicibacterium sp. CBMA 213]MUM12121.1 hypothetical protein [Mycolicibacterium sp. CBMA 293]